MILEDYDHKWTQHIVSPKNTKLPVYNEAAQRQEEKRSGGFWTERFFSSKTMTINVAHIQWDTTCDYLSIESLCDSIVRLAKERSEQLLNSDTCETNLQATASFDETLIEASTTPSKEVQKKKKNTSKGGRFEFNFRKPCQSKRKNFLRDAKSGKSTMKIRFLI